MVIKKIKHWRRKGSHILEGHKRRQRIAVALFTMALCFKVSDTWGGAYKQGSMSIDRCLVKLLLVKEETSPLTQLNCYYDHSGHSLVDGTIYYQPMRKNDFFTLWIGKSPEQNHSTQYTPVPNVVITFNGISQSDWQEVATNFDALGSGIEDVTAILFADTLTNRTLSVMMGFKQKFTALVPSLKTEIDSLLSKPSSEDGTLHISLAGHGFGASMASIAGLYLHHYLMDRAFDLSIYSFNGLKAFDNKTARYYRTLIDRCEMKYHQYTNHHDMFSLLPWGGSHILQADTRNSIPVHFQTDPCGKKFAYHPNKDRHVPILRSGALGFMTWNETLNAYPDFPKQHRLQQWITRAKRYISDPFVRTSENSQVISKKELVGR